MVKKQYLRFILFIYILLLMSTQIEAGITVMGGLTHEKQTQIGEIYKGVVFIGNNGDKPQEVKVYQTDYLFFCDGRNLYGEPGKLERSNANWITFSPHRLIIPPQQTAPVNYTVNVPDDRSLRGTYWSMLMIEGLGEEHPEATIQPEEGKTQFGIKQIIRYGIQMVTHIGDTGSRKLKFVGTKLLAKEGGGRILQIDLENTGERWLVPLLWVELYDEEGRYIGRFESSKMRIYPGTSVRHRIDLSSLPKGKYKALVVADNGDEHIFGAQYTLNF